MRIPIILTLFIWSASCFAQEDKMTNVKMWKILKEQVNDLEGQMGNWQFMVRERPVMIITDPGANRMRIVSPIIEQAKLTPEHYKVLLEANFDRALDAKYALYNQIVWSVFTHPLEELTTAQFTDAMEQVVRLSENFGTTFASTDFVFGGG